MAITTEEKLEIAKVVLDAQIDALIELVDEDHKKIFQHASRTRALAEEWLDRNPDYRPVFEEFGKEMQERADRAVAEAQAELEGENGRSA